MASFTIHGPFPIPFEKKKGGRTLTFDEFWVEGAEAQYLATSRGCYVFAMRTGGGLQPIYVGKATKTFKQETFNPGNRHKYHNGFSDYAVGTPLMYFVAHPNQKGPTNNSRISEIEDFLIQAGVVKNPNIQNIKGTLKPSWSIKGVVRSGVGKRSHGEVEFGSLFGIRG
jgi:hypothetical protein